MARKILTGLNLTNELQLNGSAGSAGQVLISSGTGSVPAWSSAPGVGAMNYAQTQATKQSTISASGVTLVSVSITTSGYPVQVLVTGDAENSAAGAWVQLQLYRGSTAIGKIVHVEGSAGSENIPYALTVVDAPAAGTYTYSLKTASAVAGGTFNFGETDGPVLTAIELAGPKGDTGSSANTFATISTPSGTSPVADSSTDTLTFTAGTGITITGDATADSIAIATNATDANTVSTIVLRDASGNFAAGTITGALFSGSGASLTSLNASNLSSGTISGDRGVTAGSATVSFIEYNGTTATAGQFDGGTVAPSGTTRLNYGGYLYATQFYGDGSNLTSLSGSNISSGTVADARIASALTGKTYNGLTVTTTTGTLTITNAKTLSVSNTLTFAGTDSTTMTFPSTSATIARTDAGNTFTGSQTVRPAATQDSVIIAGRAGGTTSLGVTITPTTLTASRTATLPDVTGTIAVIAGTLAVASGKTLTASNTLTLAGTDSTTMTFPSTSATIARTDAGNTFTGSQTVRPAATQDSVIIAGRAGGTTSLGVTITPTTLTASRTATLPDFTGNIAVISGTLAVDVGKTLTVSRTLTLTGTDSTTMTFPSTSATIARTDAAQTFTGAQTLTPAAAVAATAASTAGYIGMPQNSQSGAYTLVAADAGKHIYYTVTGQTVTIPANSSVAYEIGTTITFITAPSVSLSIAITTDTLRLANTTTTGTRTLAANGIATAVKTTATTWIISGNGLS